MRAVTPRPRLLLERFHWISYVTLTQRRCEPLHAALATPHCSGMAHVDFQPSRRRGLAECRLRGIMTGSCGRGWVPAVGSVRGCSRGSAAPCETRSFASTTRISSGARKCFARGATSRRRTGCADRRDQHQEVDFILPSPGPVELDQRSTSEIIAPAKAGAHLLVRLPRCLSADTDVRRTLRRRTRSMPRRTDICCRKRRRAAAPPGRSDARCRRRPAFEASHYI